MKRWLLAVVVASNLYATDPLDVLHAEISLFIMNAESPLPEALGPGFHSLSGLVFTEAPLQGRVTLRVEASQFNEPRGGEAFAVDPDWWKNTRLRFIPFKQGSLDESAGFDVPLSETTIVRHTRTSRNEFSLGLGETATVQFSCPVPPRGDYAVTVTHTQPGIHPMGTLWTRTTLAIRARDENPATHEARQRKLAKQTRTEFEARQKESIAQNPDDWSAWEALATASVSKMDPDLTTRYFDEAERVFRRVVLKNGNPVNEHQEAVLDYLTLFAKLRPHLEQARRDGLWIKTQRRFPYKTFGWYELAKPNWAAFQIVDPRNPSGPVRKKQ